MVLTFEIDKIGSGLYRVATTVGGGAAVTEPGMYHSIEEAIRGEVDAVPEGFAYFGEVHYGGMSSGTYLLPDLAKDATPITQRLMQLLAQAHEIDGR